MLNADPACQRSQADVEYLTCPLARHYIINFEFSIITLNFFNI